MTTKRKKRNSTPDDRAEQLKTIGQFASAVAGIIALIRSLLGR